MPTFKVTAPDGSTIDVDAPDTASDAELISLAQAKISAVKPTATFYQKMLTSIPGRALKGMKDQIDAGAQMLPRALSTVASLGGTMPNRASDWLDSEARRVDTGIKDSEREYSTARWANNQDGFDGARLFGNVVGPASIAAGMRLPAAVSTMGRIGTGALGGGIGGLMTPVSDTEGDVGFAAQKTGQVGVGALGGAVASPLLGKIADVVAPPLKALATRMFSDPAKLASRAAIEASDAVDSVVKQLGVDRASIPQQVYQEIRQQVADSFKKGEKIDASALLRKKDFDALGVPALRGQITRDPAQYSRDMNVRGIEGAGEPVANLLSAQNQKITSKLGGFGGTKAREAVPAGDMFTGALKALDDKLSESVRRAYQNARASSGKDWDVPLGGLANDVANVVDTFGIGAEKNAVPSAIASKLKSFGIINDPGMTQRKVFNYEEADKLLKQINAHDDGGNASIGALRSAVKTALSEAGGEGDPFAVARKMAGERFKLLDAIPALEAVSKARNPQEVSRLADDFVQKYIIGSKVADLKKLAEVLPPEVMDEAKKQIARVIYEGAFKSNATGDKMASPAGLNAAMKSLGTERLKVFFSQQEIDDLNRLARVTSYANTEPAWGTVARGGNPGGVLFGGMARLAGAGGKALPVVTPVLNALQGSQRAAAAMNTTIPKAANLTPEEIRLVSSLLGTSNVVAGGLLAPGPDR